MRNHHKALPLLALAASLAAAVGVGAQDNPADTADTAQSAAWHNTQQAALATRAAQDWYAMDGGLLWRRVKGDGSGAHPRPSDTVTVNYAGTFVDGTTFDSSFDRGQPATFPLAGLIPAWKLAIPQMGVGDTIEIAAPATLAYGTSGRGPIPGDATLLFTIRAAGHSQPLTGPRGLVAIRASCRNAYVARFHGERACFAARRAFCSHFKGLCSIRLCSAVGRGNVWGGSLREWHSRARAGESPMEPALLSLLAASIALVGTHFLLSHPLRAPIVGAIGTGAFLGLYSLVALATLGWMAAAFPRRACGGPGRRQRRNRLDHRQPADRPGAGAVPGFAARQSGAAELEQGAARPSPRRRAACSR